MIYNPDKPLRTAYLVALQAATGVGVWTDGIPKSVPVPISYILITTQTRTRTAVAKPTDNSGLSDNFGWLSGITFDINVISPAGFSNPGAIDDLIEKVINVAENILVPGWCIKSRVYFNTSPLNLSTPTSYINRKTVIYQHWIEKL